MRSLLVSWVLLAATCTGMADQVPLVREGQSACTIVCAADASPIVRFAARELQTYLCKASGANIAIATDREAWPDGPDWGVVLVGRSRLTEALGIRPEGLGPEGFRICTQANRLALLGVDRPNAGDGEGRVDPLDPRVQTGTLFAVYRFLESYVGVRWLWPGDLGEVVPHRKTILLGRIDYTDAPRLPQRHVGASFSGSDEWAAIGLAQDDRNRRRREYRLWAKRNGLGENAVFDATADTSNSLARYDEAHPEYGTLIAGRSRLTPAEGGAYCFSNAEVRRLLAEKAIRFLRQHPASVSAPVCTTNGSADVCSCATCRAMDLLSADHDALNGNERPSFSDRYALFCDGLASRVAAKNPEKYIVACATGVHRAAPGYAAVLPNVVITFEGFKYLDDAKCAQDRADWRGWAEAGARMFYRGTGFPNVHGMPIVYADRIGAALRFCGRYGMRGADLGVLPQHWATQGVNYYVLCRMLWDPDQRPWQLVRDFCRAGFGIAGPAVERYFARLRQAEEEITAAEDVDGTPDLSSLLAKLYAPKSLAEYEVILSDAARLAAREGPRASQRVAFLQTGLRYARIQSRVTAANALQALRERDEFYESQKAGWALNVRLLVQQESASQHARRRMAGDTKERKP